MGVLSRYEVLQILHDDHGNLVMSAQDKITRVLNAQLEMSPIYLRATSLTTMDLMMVLRWGVEQHQGIKRALAYVNTRFSDSSSRLEFPLYVLPAVLYRRRDSDA